MSETISPVVINSATPNLDTQIRAEQVLARDVLPTREDFIGMLDSSTTNGTINVFPVESAREYDGTLISVPVEIEPSDLAGSDLNYEALPTYINPKQADELGIGVMPEVLKKEALAVQEGVRQEIIDDQAWFLADSMVAEEAEKGSISQVFKVDLGNGAHIDVINFSESQLNQVHLEELSDAITRMFNATGGNVAEAVHGIAILPEERFEGKNIANATIRSKTVKLSEVLVNSAKFSALEEKLNEKHNVLGAASSFQATVTHEMMHLVEGLQSEYSEHNYRARMGWSPVEIETFVDDYGNVVSKRKSRYVVPDRQQYVGSSEGEQTSVDVAEEFGRDAYVQARPVSVYGHTDGREDLAEAAVAYMYGSDLDSVRKNAIDNIFNEVRGEAGATDSVTIKQIEAAEYSRQLEVKPVEIGVITSLRKASLGTNRIENTGYASVDSRFGVVDDYGNLVERTVRAQPKAK